MSRDADQVPGAAGDPIAVEVVDAVAHVRITKPEAKNALTPADRDRLTGVFEDLSADLGVRAVVLTGAGDTFCTGADLRGRGRQASPRPEGAPPRAMGDASRMIRRGWQRLVGALQDCEKPVVAAVNGTAAGGGAHLALACDLVVMAESARLIEVFVRRGIMPDAGGAYLLPRMIGLHRAKELMFLGDDVSAAEADRIGLVNRVVADADLAAAAAALAARLAAGPTKAIAATKALLNRSFESDRATAFAEEAWLQELVNGTTDAAEGMRSFAERRPPSFRGW